MQQSGEVIKVLESQPVVATRRAMLNRSDALVAVLIVAIWLLASWTATASEIVHSASTGIATASHVCN